MGILDKLFGKKSKDLEVKKKSREIKAKESTDTAEDHLRAAYTLWNDKKNLKDAIKECKAAIKINPNFAMAHCMLADIYSQQNKLDDAARAYKDALQVDPNYALARSNLGMVYRFQGNDEAAIKEWEETLRRGVESTIIRMNTEDFIKEARERLATRERNRKAEIEASGSPKAEKIREMEEAGRGLRGTEAKFDTAFEALFSDLQDGDSDVRAAAARLLADNPNSIRKLISVYQDCLGSDPSKSVLAGRVLGRKEDAGSQQMIHAEISAIRYGIQVAFTPCVCGHCRKLNVGIPVPEGGLHTPFYGQQDDQNCAYALPVLCDFCGKEFFIAWDRDPR